MRVLVIQTAFLGDVVLTTALLRSITATHPHAIFDFVTTPQGHAILSGLPNVHSVICDKKNQSFLNSIRQVEKVIEGRKYDYIFCVHRSPRSLYLASRIPATKKIAFKSLSAKILGFHCVPYPIYDEKNHYVDKVLSLLDGTEFTARERQPVLSSFVGNLSSHIVVSPFSTWKTKEWNIEKFAELISRLVKEDGMTIEVTGSNDDFEKSKILDELVHSRLSGSANPEKYKNLIGKTKISTLRERIGSASLVVANDSAPVHIAAAYNIPTVAIFGPTALKWGFGPLSQQNSVVENSKLNCRPCHIHGKNKCPQKHFKCMNEISVEDVLTNVRRLISERTNGTI